MTTAISKVDELKRGLVTMKKEFESVLPKHIDPDKFVRMTQTAIAIQPELAQCNRNGFYAELLKCAQDGLMPDGREATILKFKDEAKYIPGIFGLCKKARNSGEIKSIDALVVYENDDYSAWADENGQHFKFVKARGDRGKVLVTIAYALTTEGFFFEEIDEKQMAAIEATSKQKGGPWKGPFKDEMRRKSALRRLAKYRLPSSADLDRTMSRDDDLYDLPRNDPKPAAQDDPPAATPSRLKAAVTGKTEPAKQAAQPKPKREPAPAAAQDEAPHPAETVSEDEIPI